jgi:hypothetical protein
MSMCLLALVGDLMLGWGIGPAGDIAKGRRDSA